MGPVESSVPTEHQEDPVPIPDPQGLAGPSRGCCARWPHWGGRGQGLLCDRKGLLDLCPGSLQIPKVLQHPAEIVKRPSDLGVVGGVDGLRDAQLALVGGPGTGQVPRLCNTKPRVASAIPRSA
jgi:hypothetical protein